MNFLAHLYLADDCPEALIGSIMPDLARRAGAAGTAALPAATRRAIDQHRAVDAFTDSHAVVHRSKARIRARHGIYSGILIDVFYDHILAGAWERYATESLPVFIGRVHEAFRSHAHLMPEAMRYPVDRLIAQDWLSSYATAEGMTLALTRLSQRLAQRFEREVHLEAAVVDMVAQGRELAGDFHEFFPELIAFSRPAARASVPTTERAESPTIGVAPMTGMELLHDHR
jgi:acyl carrier protein phosphodiesterase